MYNRTRIKICGITRPQDANSAAVLGVDAIGLVFYEKSPRYVTAKGAQEILGALPPFVTVVGLFMNAAASSVEQILKQVRIDTLQFHGSESPEYCSSFAVPYIKSVPMKDQPDLMEYTSGFPTASGFLLDAVAQGEPGGSGQRFQWSQVPNQFDRPLVLAGGLTPANVAAAVQQTGCYAVDVSSGVESAKGIKDSEKMHTFIMNVKGAC